MLIVQRYWGSFSGDKNFLLNNILLLNLRLSDKIWHIIIIGLYTPYAYNVDPYVPCALATIHANPMDTHYLPSLVQILRPDSPTPQVRFLSAKTSIQERSKATSSSNAVSHVNNLACGMLRLLPLSWSVLLSSMRALGRCIKFVRRWFASRFCISTSPA